jgi:hypothetical protein
VIVTDDIGLSRFRSQRNPSLACLSGLDRSRFQLTSRRALNITGL